MVTDVKNSVDINKYKITQHARLRFKERVSENKNPSMKEIREWLNRAFSRGYKIGKERGRERYRYGQYLIIVEYKTIITISYYAYNEFKYDQKKLENGDISGFRKVVRGKVNHRKSILIKCNKIDIERIMSNSIEEQKYLEKTIEDLRLEASKMKKQIKALISVANDYGISKSELILEGDLIW